jgi:hypothetical protein
MAEEEVSWDGPLKLIRDFRELIALVEREAQAS